MKLELWYTTPKYKEWQQTKHVNVMEEDGLPDSTISTNGPVGPLGGPSDQQTGR